MLIRRWPQFTLASLLTVVAVWCLYFAVLRTRQVQLARQQTIITEWEQFGAKATYNSYSVATLRFEPATHQLGDEHLESVESLEQLWFLDLYHTRITDRGLVHLETLNNLRWISLPKIGITEDAIRRLHNKLPDAKLSRRSWSSASSE